MKTHPLLLIHGGAGGKILSADQRAVFISSLSRILNEAYPRLQRGGSALEAVIHAVTELENDPLYNAGKGSKIQADGHIRMSASVMDGDKQRFAGCVNVEGVKNPIRLAKALLHRQDRVLSGKGARRFAREHGIPFASPFTAAQKQDFAMRKSGKSGTVGALALDHRGKLAAATSTGGRGFEYPFRVSDTPTTAGNFANSVCAVSATGVGEQIVEFSVASTLCAYVDAGLTLDQAVRRLFLRAKRKKAAFGVIAMDRHGQFIAKTTTPFMVWAAAGRDGHQFMR